VWLQYKVPVNKLVLQFCGELRRGELERDRGGQRGERQRTWQKIGTKTPHTEGKRVSEWGRGNKKLPLASTWLVQGLYTYIYVLAMATDRMSDGGEAGCINRHYEGLNFGATEVLAIDTWHWEILPAWLLRIYGDNLTRTVQKILENRPLPQA